MSLDDRFDLIEQAVTLPLGDVRLRKPRNPDTLISEADFARDDRLPYWADIWSASVVLARFVETQPRVGRALELGCGLGLVAIAATRAGCEVTATDYYDDALLFTTENALRAGVRAPATRHVDWRALPDDLGTFDLVLAADVLYERPYAELVAAAIARTLAPSGRALVADQGRLALEEFLAAVTARGLTHRVAHHEQRPVEPPAPEGSAVHAITIYELSRE